MNTLQIIASKANLPHQTHNEASESVKKIFGKRIKIVWVDTKRPSTVHYSISWGEGLLFIQNEEINISIEEAYYVPLHEIEKIEIL